MVVKTFRGLLADGGQDRIRLSTIKGKMGYRIVKFEVIGEKPGTLNLESIFKIYKEEQSSIDGVINFTDSSLLSAGYYIDNSSSATPTSSVIIFDSEMFNQDIYITHSDVSGTAVSGNYYIELEVIPLDDAGAEYTTLKDMRS